MAVKRIVRIVAVALVVLMLVSACGEVPLNTSAGSSTRYVEDKLSLLSQEESAHDTVPPPVSTTDTMGLESEPGVGSEPETETESGPESGAEPGQQSGAESESNSGVEQETESESGSETEQESMEESEPVVEPVQEPDSGAGSTSEDTPPVIAPEPSPRFIFPYWFTAMDLYGNPVNERTLGEREVFFVQYWGTWCPPCVGEMPELAELARMYGNRVGFIALLDDYDSNLDRAIQIVESSGIPNRFIMIDAHEPSASQILNLLKSGYVPTTVLISTDGVGEQLIGSYGLGFAREIDKLLS